MIFDSRSNYMLKYEKAKSKLVEFNISEKDYPNFPLDPDDLTYSTILALSQYCEELIENPESKALPTMFDTLGIVSRYYDSTIKTRRRTAYDSLFLMLGTTAYFLSENFGSAKVLVGQIERDSLDNAIVILLFDTFRFLLDGVSPEEMPMQVDYSSYIKAIVGHFQSGTSPVEIFNELQKIRHDVYRSTNAMSVNYIDFLYAVLLRAVEYSAWILLPQHSGESMQKWHNYPSNPDSIKLLWPAQKVILQAGACAGENLVVPLPTGVGKTKSIELILRSAFMRKGISVAVIVAPLRALCNEITTDLQNAFDDEVIINQFSDTTQEDFDIELEASTEYVFVCTPEKFSYILRHAPDFLRSIQLFIFDEAHLFDDNSRGAHYELLVSEIARNKAENSQVVLFSAVLANADQISDWLFNDASATIDHALVKSTEKSIGFLSSDSTIHYYEKDDMHAESFFVPESITTVQLRLNGKETKTRLFPEKKSARDYAIYYAVKLCVQGGAAIFAGRAKSIPPIMRRIAEINERGYNLTNLFFHANTNEVIKLSALFAAHYGEDSELTQAAKLGAFPHYSHLPNGLKLAIEHALRRKHIHFVVCTTTLAEGVNIPIKYLLIMTFSYGDSSIQIRKMQNLVGRTARPGIHTEGSAIVADPKFYDNRLSWKGGGKFRWDDCKKMFDYSYTEACGSSILSLVSDLTVDFKNKYPANALSDYLIKNYQKPSCFAALQSMLENEYKQRVSEENFAQYSPTIRPKVMHLERVIGNIENYLCYIFNTYQDRDWFLAAIETLTKSTFAYYLADSEQKERLEVIFRLIAEKIVFSVPTSKISYYAKSLYGIEVSTQILEWIDQNIDELSDLSMEQLSDKSLELFVRLFAHEINIDAESFYIIVREWLNGFSYFNIHRKVEGLTLNQVERSCSNTISYKLSSFIGNIIDAIMDRNEELIERLADLQKQVKYGVSTRFQLLICENVFDDRLLAKEVGGVVGNTTITSDGQLKLLMRRYRREILELLTKYPDYFSYRFRNYIR